jgi:hypothetical protein
MTTEEQLFLLAPSPQLSQDDLVRGLEVLSNNKQPITPSVSTGLLSPISPKHDDLEVVGEEQEEEGLDMVDDEFQMENGKKL